jgi:hypothetical protein
MKSRSPSRPAQTAQSGTRASHSGGQLTGSQADAALAAMPVTAIDLDDLPTAELAPFAGLILAGRSDQGLLATMQDKLRGFLDEGRVVVFSGQLTHDWLPGATAFEPGRSWAANRDRPNCTTTRSSPVRRPTTSARPFSTRTAGIVSRSAPT